MGWIVEAIVDRLHRCVGRWPADNWRGFIDRYDLDCVYADLPQSLPAISIDGVIVIGRHLPPNEAAWWAWHEVAHHVLHCGGREDWRRMVCGDLILTKFERQADDFALLFPDWD